MTKVIIVDDHKMFRNGVKLMVEAEKIGEIIAEAENGQQFLDLLKTLKPDVVLMDIDMPIMGGIEATEKAIDKYPDLKILALSMFGDEKFYSKMLSAGAKGFLLKKSGMSELFKGIKEVAEGESYFSNELLRKMVINLEKEKQKEENIQKIIKFTKREMEILKLLCNGKSTNEIAETISLSPKTIDSYRSKLISKTNTKNTVSLVIYAIKNKLITI